ncbi:hypothetical protein D3C77_559210 [compost metagenome]
MALILSPDVGITAQPGKFNGAGCLEVARSSVAQTIALRLPASHAFSGGKIAQRCLDQRNFLIHNFGEMNADGLLIDHRLPVPADKFPAPYVVVVGETLFHGLFQSVDRETVDTLNTRQGLAQPLADNQAVAHRIAKCAQLLGTGLAQPGG